MEDVESQEEMNLMISSFQEVVRKRLSAVIYSSSVQFSSVQSLSRVRLFVTPLTAACQTSLSITNSWSLLKLMSTESVMPSNHLILSCPLLFLPSVFPSIRVISSESVLHIRWPKSIGASASHQFFQGIFRTDFF